MTLYDDFEVPVRPALEAAHARTLRSFAQAGTWYDAPARHALVAAARRARVEAGIQETAADADDAPAPDVLPAPARRVARQVAVSTNDLTREFLEQALADGLTDAEYVEIVGVVSRAVSVDVFARGIGVRSRALPPAEPGAPRRTRPIAARDEGAWTHTVPGGSRGGDEAKAIYGSADPQAAPFIYRALSLVPDEAAGLVALGTAQYLPLPEFMNLAFTFEPTLSRPQYELVAARVSARNACFY